ncbi:MAG: hypothetical protein JWM81_98 [Candidatus Saccharibacteria bacterium]|nr:hypothetical protein [Candidatus Saccharibacteria bacterium]
MFEIIIDQNKVVLEAVGQMQGTIKTLATKGDLHRLEVKVDTIQLALPHTNKDVVDLNSRVTVLEHHKH